MAVVPGGTDRLRPSDMARQSRIAARSLRGLFGVGVTVVLAGWLAGCGTMPAPGATADLAAAAPVSSVASATPPSAAAHDAAAKVAALVNLTQADMAATFGKPDFTRVDAPAEIWQYRSANCVLDVFFYPEGSGMRVSYASTRSRGLIKVAENVCFPGPPALPKSITTEARSS